MAKSARTETAVLAGAVILGVVICYGLTIVREDQANGLSPNLFALPLALALLWLGRLRWIGALYVALTIPAGWFSAIYASMAAQSALHVSLCIFSCSADEVAANAWRMQIVGAVGGFVGAAVPFILLMPLGRALRDARALTIMAIALPALALLGSTGFTLSIPGTPLKIDPDAPQYVRNLLFIGPWQLVFGTALARLRGFKDAA